MDNVRKNVSNNEYLIYIRKFVYTLFILKKNYIKIKLRSFFLKSVIIKFNIFISVINKQLENQIKNVLSKHNPDELIIYE